MLQIITGKFYTTDELHGMHHRGVLYTNYAPIMETMKAPIGSFQSFETPVGSMLPTAAIGDIFPWVYEVEEKLEAVRPDGTREFMLSVGGDFLIQDFAAVAAFALNITCTPDFDLARRVIHGGHASLGVPRLPKEYVGHVFEPRIEAQEGDDARLHGFITDLVGLKRETYKGAMRAIRRYVNGLHRLADDLDLAYTLLVASIESLAQGFDGFAPTWQDYAQRKREPLDKILGRATPEVAQGVRDVLLAQEHLALTKRYHAFVLDHLQPSFFREEAALEKSPVRRCDLPGALQRAYEFRSRYVHSLVELPRNLTVPPFAGDTARVEGKTVLTFHGLARIARHVIHDFIARSPKVEREEFDYRQDLPNIVRVELAFSVWGTAHGGYSHHSARRFINGFLQDLTTALLQLPGAMLTDVRPILEKIEEQVPGLAKPEQRRPMLLLYILFHRFVPSEHHRPDHEQFIDKYAADFDAPSFESLLGHVLLDIKPDWTPAQFEEVRGTYFKQRESKIGLRFGATFEAAATLFSAEFHRRDGQEQRVHELVSEAVENLPGHALLLEFEKSMSQEQEPLQKINWFQLLLPLPTPPESLEPGEASPSADGEDGLEEAAQA